MSWMRGPVLGVVGRFLGRLRFPQLFGLMAVLFVADLLIPDAIPFVDELMLAMGTLLLGSLRRKEVPEENGEA